MDSCVNLRRTDFIHLNIPRDLFQTCYLVWYLTIYCNIQIFLSVFKYFFGVTACPVPPLVNQNNTPTRCQRLVLLFLPVDNHTSASLRPWIFKVYRSRSLWPWRSCGVGWFWPSSPSAGGYRTKHAPPPSPDGEPPPSAQSPEMMAYSSPQNSFLRLP